MSEIDSIERQTPTAVALEYTDITNILKEKKLSINARYRLPVSPSTSPLACDTICQTGASPFVAPA